MSTPPDFFAHDYEPQPEPDADDERRQAVPPPPDGQRRQAPPPPSEASTTATGRAAPAKPPPPDEQRRQAPQAPPPPAGPPAQHYPKPPSHPIIARPPYPQGQPGAPVPAWQPTPDSRADFGDTDPDAFFTEQPPASEHGPNTPAPDWPAPPASNQPPTTGPQSLFGGPVTGAAPSLQPSGGGDGADEQNAVVVPHRRRPAGKGWRKAVSKMTAGAVNPGPSAKQEQAEELIHRIRASLVDVHKVAFISAKGGVGKTTMTVAAGNAIARERGDRVIAVDVNTDLGDLSTRFNENGGPQANIEALSSLRHAGSYSNVRVYTVQNDDRLEMLGSQNDPRSSYTLNGQDYGATMEILETHYNVILLDCGTAITSPLFSTIAKDVSSLVVVASQNTRGLNGAWSTLQWLHAHGFGRLLPRTVVVFNATDRGKPLVDLDEAETKFRERIAEVVRVPYDPHLAEGMGIDFDGLKPRTRKALMDLAGAVAQHYPARQVHRVRTH